MHGQNDNTASFGSGIVYSGEPASDNYGLTGENARINITQGSNIAVSDNTNPGQENGEMTFGQRQEAQPTGGLDPVANQMQRRRKWQDVNQFKE